MVSLVARFGPARMWGAEIKSWEDYFAAWRASAPRNDGARHQANSPLSPMFHVEHGKLNTRAGNVNYPGSPCDLAHFLPRNRSSAQ